MHPRPSRLATTLVALALLTSCGGDGPTEIDASVSGRWRLVSLNGATPGANEAREWGLFVPVPYGAGTRSRVVGQWNGAAIGGYWIFPGGDSVTIEALLVTPGVQHVGGYQHDYRISQAGDQLTLTDGTVTELYDKISDQPE